WVATQLQARGINGSALVIEFALEVISAKVQAVRELSSALVPNGVRFCLSHLERWLEGDGVLEPLPVDYIKLSTRCLTASATPSRRGALRVSVDRARRRGLSLIAQHVEDPPAAATLWMAGIDYNQGHLVQLAGRELEFDFQAAVL